MPSGVMLDNIALPLVQDVRTHEDQALVSLPVPGMEGAAYQHLGRRPALITVLGMLADDESLAALEELRRRFYAHDPLPFSADITTATDVRQVVIDDLQVRELAGRPQQFHYTLRLLEYVPPPPPAPLVQAPGVDLDADAFLAGVGDLLGLPDLSLDDPLPPLRGLLDGAREHATRLSEVLRPLAELLGD
ncbi:MAG: hypothetical protein SNJ69_06740 [Chloroflexaceae bacterium]